MLRQTKVFLLLCALALSCAARQSATAQTRVPPIPLRERTLSNGLVIYSAQERSSPTVAIQVWYKVGSKDDPQGRSGFAHLFEHLMFKSSANMKDEMMDRLTEDVGGWNNASTNDDVTKYYEVVPSNYLETLLWAEADRMGSLNVTEKNFPSERDVVKEEFNTSVLAPPYGRLYYAIDKDSFSVHPYRRPTIGSKEELDAANIQDVRAFHSTFYRPDNAVLIVVGDFDDKQLDAWVDKYFAKIPKPSTPIPRVTLKEPARTAEKRFDETGPNVPLPAVAITYLAPPVSSPDADVLRVAESILSEGESSRLYQSLVYSQQVAAEAFGNADLREDQGLFVLGAILAGDKKPAEAERALLAELKRMQDEPVSKAELDKAVNQLVASQLRERETNSGKAFAIGNAAVLMGDARRVNTDIERLQAVTAADIQRVMKKYFSDSNRVVITYRAQQQQGQPAAGGAQKEGGR
ncbi:MAG TPA: pitrilysin family protein [Pyrinomonadaceae bacterium]|jgi:zinc protease|nr:pitrilysin family protein [Pyrinomonadaceae bacterium]